MKQIIKNVILASLLISLGACQKKSKDESSDLPIIDGMITVKFFVDFTRTDDKDIFASYEIENCSLLTPPSETPEAIYPEFPVFKGWSHKEVIDDLNDIWDFSIDKMESTTKTFNMFGIWVTEGE